MRTEMEGDEGLITLEFFSNSLTWSNRYEGVKVAAPPGCFDLTFYDHFQYYDVATRKFDRRSFRGPLSLERSFTVIGGVR